MKNNAFPLKKPFSFTAGEATIKADAERMRECIMDGRSDAVRENVLNGNVYSWLETTWWCLDYNFEDRPSFEKLAQAHFLNVNDDEMREEARQIFQRYIELNNNII